MQNDIAKWLGAWDWDHTKQGFVKVFEKSICWTSEETELPQNEVFGNKNTIYIIDRADMGGLNIFGS